MRAWSRRRVAACSLAVLACSLAWGIPSARPLARAASAADTKTVFAIAVDQNDDPVKNLTADDWRIREDNVDRAILDVKPASDPLDLVLIVDTSILTQGAIQQLRAALEAFTHAIFDGNHNATISVMDAAGAAVLAADRKHSAAELDPILAKTFPDRSGSAVILEAMTEASKRLRNSPSPRRAIVVVNLEETPDQSGSYEPQRVIDQVVGCGASVWVVSYRSGGPVSAGTAPSSLGVSNGQNRDAVLNLVPAGTGGIRLTVDLPSALAGALANAADVLLSQYAISFTRPPGPTPHQLQMGQARSGVKIVYPSTPPK